MPSSVGAARRTSDLRRPRRPQPAQHPHDRRSGRADRLGRGARRRPRPRPGDAPQRCRSRRRGARHRRASVGRMGSRRLLGRRTRSQAARRSSSGLSSSGSESRDHAYCRDLRRRFRRLGSTGRAHRTASSGLEYCGESGRFHYNHWDISDGPVYRSLRFDHRNREGELGMVSIILDARRQ